MATKATKFDKLNTKASKIAGFVSAILVIGGALVGAGNWMSGQITGAISAQIDDFRSEVKSSNDSQDLAIMRLELMNLMQNDPDNVVEIEMLGKKYFQNGGNSYMSRLYSDYAREHGLDTSFIVGGK